MRSLHVALALAVAAFAVGVLVRDPGSGQVPALDIGAYCGAYLLGAALLLVQARDTGRERWAWRALAVGMIVTTGGDLYYSLVLAPLDEPPYPSPADALYLSWYPLAHLALLLLLRARVRRFYPSMALDGVVAGLGAGALAGGYLLDDLLALDGSAPAEAITTLAYPLADLLLILVLVAGCAVLGLRASRTLVLVVVGLALTTAADVLFLLAEAAGTYAEGGALDLLWLLGVVALSRAPRTGPEEAPQDDASRERTRVTLRVLALPAAAALASLGLLALDQLHPVPPGAGLGAAACVLTAFVRVALTFSDVRRREEGDYAAVLRQARTDELTGLPNRRALQEACDDLVAAAGPGSPGSLLVLDLDRFKEINDSLGHGAGDQLLRLVAGRVRRALGEGALVGRLGGDEFAVVLPGTGAEEALAVGHRVHERLTAPFTVEGLRLHVDASIGVATTSGGASGRAELLRSADTAMYAAKRERRGVVAATAEDAAAAHERLLLLEELRSALEGEDAAGCGHLEVHLQPQVHLADGSVAGVEALVRWQHPGRGQLAPDAFLPLAAAAGLMGRVADAVLELSLGACARWWSAQDAVPVAVNLCAEDVQDATLPARVEAALARHGLPGSALVLELTEEAFVTDPARARRHLDAVRRLGVRVSLDDYGTGYSSLAQLRDLAVDEVKLDRSFTAGVADDPTAAAIVRTTVDLAHALGARLVAEGVEDARSQQALARLGCDVGQGWAVARPMPPAALLGWLAGRRGAPAPRPRGPVAAPVVTSTVGP